MTKSTYIAQNGLPLLHSEITNVCTAHCFSVVRSSDGPSMLLSSQWVVSSGIAYNTIIVDESNYTVFLGTVLEMSEELINLLWLCLLKPGKAL